MSRNTKRDIVTRYDLDAVAGGIEIALDQYLLLTQCPWLMMYSRTCASE